MAEVLTSLAVPANLFGTVGRVVWGPENRGKLSTICLPD